MTRIDRTTSSTRPALRGVFTALVTPFATDGSIDEAALRQLVRWQVLTGIDGLVPVGTTGESPTLTPAERDRVIALTVETVAERP
jgi:4-hydroxy-tetrahydrodipicolinate synthase